MTKNKHLIKLTDTDSTYDYPFTSTKAYHIERVYIPYSFYNISSDKANNILDVNGTPVTIPDGNYTSSQLASQLSLLLVAIDASFTSVINTQTAKLTIARTGNFTLNFNNNIGEVLGFTSNKSGADTYTGDSVVNLSDTFINIFSDELYRVTRKKNLFQFQSGYITSIPISGYFGDNIVFEPNVKEIEILTENHIDSIDFTLKDKNNKKLNLNGHPVYIELVITS